MTILQIAIFIQALSGKAFGAVFALAFFLVFLAVAYVAFRALKKTVKMAFRMVVVAIIMFIAIAGSITLYYFSGGQPKLKPPGKSVSQVFETNRHRIA